MYIYQSTEVRPYIYICTHKTTGEFYIGYREANKIESHLDFPLYKTSSKIVKSNFDDYNWVIFAEFINGIDAYDYEQQLIFENWNNSLLLNKSCRAGKSRFRRIGPMSSKHKQKISVGNLGKIRSADAKQKLSHINKGKTVSNEQKEKLQQLAKTRIGIPRTNEVKQKISNANSGRIFTEAHRAKLSAAKKARAPYIFSEEQKAEISRKISEAKRRPK